MLCGKLKYTRLTYQVNLNSMSAKEHTQAGEIEGLFFLKLLFVMKNKEKKKENIE